MNSREFPLNFFLDRDKQLSERKSAILGGFSATQHRFQISSRYRVSGGLPGPGG